MQHMYRTDPKPDRGILPIGYPRLVNIEYAIDVQRQEKKENRKRKEKSVNGPASLDHDLTVAARDWFGPDDRPIQPRSRSRNGDAR